MIAQSEPAADVCVLVVDDHPIVRRGMAALLGTLPWVHRTIEAGTAVAAAAAVVTERPDAAVVDLGLPDGDGVALIRRIRRTAPDCAVLVLTMTRDPGAVRTCLEAGAGGYLLKESAPDALVAALRTVLDGGVYLGPRLGAQTLLTMRRDVPPPFDVLSPREVLIVRHLASGRTTAEIARRLDVSEKTVRNQLAAVLPKIGVTDRIQAALLARDVGLVD